MYERGIQVINTTTDPEILKNGVSLLSSLFLTIEPRNNMNAKIETTTLVEIFKRQKDSNILAYISQALKHLSEINGMTQHILDLGILPSLIDSLQYK